MIEVIYKEEKPGTEHSDDQLALPRNVRQIGLAAENHRIYMEDYVYTFLNGIAGEIKEDREGQAAILTGNTRWIQGTAYIFIKGALLAEGMELSREHLDFSEKVWKKVHETKDEYFPDQDIVGWYFAPAQVHGDTGEILAKIHLRHFGIEKVLMLMDPAEKEEGFYRYDSGSMIKLEGYYIYYEKNTEMQAYMIDKKQEMQIPVTEEADDKAVKSFRKIIRGKNKEETQEETEGKTSVFSYAATACLAIAVLAVGVNFYGDYRGIRTETEGSRPVSVNTSVTTEPERERPVTPAVSGTAEKREDGREIETVKMQQSTETKSSGKENGQNSENTGEQQKDSLGGTEQTSDTKNSDQKKSDQIKSKQKDPDQKTTQQTDENSSSENAKSTSAGSEKQTSDIYKEESDIRKAKRRERTEKEENGEQAQSSAGDSVHETYVIRPGDTIYQISIEKYGSMDKIQEICELNGISQEEIIYPGQIIVLP